MAMASFQISVWRPSSPCETVSATSPTNTSFSPVYILALINPLQRSRNQKQKSADCLSFHLGQEPASAAVCGNSIVATATTSIATITGDDGHPARGTVLQWPHVLCTAPARPTGPRAGALRRARHLPIRFVPPGVRSGLGQAVAG